MKGGQAVGGLLMVANGPLGIYSLALWHGAGQVNEHSPPRVLHGEKIEWCLCVYDPPESYSRVQVSGHLSLT